MVSVNVEIAPYQRLKFKRAIEWLRDKVSLPSEQWDELVDEIQSYAFSIAGVESALVLQAIQDKLVQVLEGRSTINSFQDFANTFNTTMESAGYGKQSPWRTRLMYGQNLRTAYGTARHQQALELSDRLPYVQWWHDDPITPRPAHAALHQKVFPASSPLAQTILPCGFGCRCKWLWLSERDVQREGLKVEEPPSDTIKVRDRITGEVQELPAIRVDGELLPIVDPGFNRTVQDTQRSRQEIIDRGLSRLSPQLREQAQRRIDGV